MWCYMTSLFGKYLIYIIDSMDGIDINNSLAVVIVGTKDKYNFMQVHQYVPKYTRTHVCNHTNVKS